MMLKTTEGTAILLAADFKTTLEDVDRSLSSTLKAAGLLPEAFEGSGLPAGSSQKIYQRMSNAFAGLVASRGEVVSTVAHLQALKKRSNCAETALGCPEGWSEIAVNTDEPLGQGSSSNLISSIG